jgi:hypothetical protein
MVAEISRKENTMTTLENTVVGTYTVLGSTGADGYPTLDTVTQTARQQADGQWILVEEDDHYNQEAKVGGPYKSLARLHYAASRRRERLSVKEGEHEAAMAEYEAARAEEDRRTQAEVDAVATQGMDALWAELAKDDRDYLRAKKLGMAVLTQLGVTADPEKVSVSCGYGRLEKAPEGLKDVAAPGPVHESTGAYRYTSPRGHHHRQVVGWHAGSGPHITVYGEERRDPGLTSNEGKTPQEIYAPAGTWFQHRDSGTGEIWGYRFV